jgi:hypothetical protein
LKPEEKKNGKHNGKQYQSEKDLQDQFERTSSSVDFP